jgi:hypothetical protein
VAITDEDKVRVAEMNETTTSITQAADFLAYMKQRGSSLTLDWGDDTDQWECSWISSGDRFVGVARSPALAAARCYEAMVAAKRDHSGDRLPQGE